MVIKFFTCISCNATFFSEKKTAKCCSMKCKGDAMRRRLIRVSDVIKPRNPIVQFTCGGCGKSIEVRARKHRPIPKFCSYKCMGLGTTLAWPTSNRPANLRVWLRKHGHMTHCERCGYNETPGILSIHHKDRDRAHNTQDNIEILCPNCHAIEHLDEHKDGWKSKRRNGELHAA
jgi:hypothetical protein